MARYKTELEIKTGDGAPLCGDTYLAALRHALDALCSVVFLKRFKVTLIGVERWRYEFETQDGRTWKQEIDTHVPGVVSLLTDIPDEWTLEEIDKHRLVREALLALILIFQVEEVEVTWDV